MGADESEDTITSSWPPRDGRKDACGKLYQSMYDL
jgi:hypothetical protein